MKYEQDTIKDVQNVLNTLPDVFNEIKEKLEMILVLLEEAAEIEKDLDGPTPHYIGFVVYDLMAKGLPFAEAIRRVSRAEKMPKKDVIYCYQWRYRHIRNHQQYIANLCVKLLVDAGYKRINACKIVQKMDLPSLHFVADVDDVADGYTREVVEYEKFYKRKAEKNPWLNRTICEEPPDKSEGS